MTDPVDAGLPLGRFAWHDLMTPDAERARAYYADLVGWTYEDTEIPGFGKYPMIRAVGRSWGRLVRVKEEAPPHWLSHVIVEDADGAAARAEALGGRTVYPPTDVPGVGRFTVIASPGGAPVSAWRPSNPEDEGDVPRLPGAFVWHQLLASQPEVEVPFVCEIFGWEASAQEIGGLPCTLFQRKDTGKPAGGMLPKPPGSGGPSSWLVYVAVESADATADRVRELGGSVWVEPSDIPGMGRFLVTSDPSGAMIAFIQPAR